MIISKFSFVSVLLDILLPQAAVALMSGIDHQYKQTFRDKRCTFNTYLKLNGLSELRCIFQCSDDTECGSINHHGDKNVCELNHIMADGGGGGGGETSPRLESVKGWNHFIKSKPKPKSIPTNNSLWIAEGMIPSRNQIINILPIQTDVWELSFDMVLKHDLSYTTNIIRLSTAEKEDSDLNEIGGRIPAVFAHHKKLLIRFATGTEGNYAVDHSIELNRKYNVKIRQLLFADNSNMLKQVLINGQPIETVYHEIYSTKFKNVKFLMGERQRRAAPVRVSNLRYTTNLLYEENILPSMERLVTITTFPKWPPSTTNWFFQFNLDLSDNNALSYVHPWYKPIFIVTHDSNNVRRLLPAFEFMTDWRLRVYTTGSNTGTLISSTVNLSSYIGTEITIRFEHAVENLEQRKYKVSTYFNGVQKIYYFEYYDPVIYEDVRVLHGGLAQMDFVIKDISYEYFGGAEDSKQSSTNSINKCTTPLIPPPSCQMISTHPPLSSYAISPRPPPRFVNVNLQDGRVSNNESKLPELPRLPTKQASLPVEIQRMSTKEIYPNQETSQSLEEKKQAEEKKEAELKERQKCEKKIVWNTNAPVNPFAHNHRYTKEPGAWNPHPKEKGHHDSGENTFRTSSDAKIARKLIETAEPNHKMNSSEPEISPLDMPNPHQIPEADHLPVPPPVKKKRANDGRKRI